MNGSINRAVFVLVQLALLIAFGVSQANAQDNDTVAPVIQEASVKITPDNKHSFSANIIDNVSVHRVLLSFRQKNAANYRTVSMQRSSDVDWFEATLANQIPADATIDYVIQAVDGAGNDARKTYKFHPMLTDNNQSNSLPFDTDKATETGAAERPETVKPAKRINVKTVMYGLLGVLAVGAVAASLDAGTDSSPTAECCTLTITAPTL